MSAQYLPIILTFLTAAALPVLTAAAANKVTYRATNNAATTVGGDVYEKQIGNEYTLNILPAATDFVWRTFHQIDTGGAAGSRKPVQEVNLYIDDMGGVAFTMYEEIHVSANYLAGYASSGDQGVQVEFAGIVVHEMTHVWQWYGKGMAPGGLIEGIADYVRLKAGYVPSHWVGPGKGDRWDQGYDVTARFLDYCDGVKGGFVAELNKKMRTRYGVEFFQDLTGKSVDQLWSDYKAKYA